MKDTSSSSAISDGTKVHLCETDHGTLLQEIVEEFAQRFVRSPKVLYRGNGIDKEIVADDEVMRDLGIRLPERNKTPDVLIHDTERDWLFIIEAVTSHGPIDEKRKSELKELFADARPGLIFLTAFPDRETHAHFFEAIAWETEVWIADAPDHMIHFNGKRFLRPDA